MYDEYHPTYQPDITAIYTLKPGQEQTFDQPGYLPEVEWVDIEINGSPVGIELYAFLIEQFGADWEQEIINRIQARRVA